MLIITLNFDLWKCFPENDCKRFVLTEMGQTYSWLDQHKMRSDLFMTPSIMLQANKQRKQEMLTTISSLIHLLVADFGAYQAPHLLELQHKPSWCSPVFQRPNVAQTAVVGRRQRLWFIDPEFITETEKVDLLQGFSHFLMWKKQVQSKLVIEFYELCTSEHGKRDDWLNEWMNTTLFDQM